MPAVLLRCPLFFRGRRPDRPDAKYPKRAGDVLQLLLADILEGEVDAAVGVFLDALGDADAARFGDPLEAGSDVDAIAKYVAVLDDNVTLVDADP